MSLHELIKNSDLDGLKSSITNGSDINQSDKLKRCPVHIASWAGNVVALQALILAGAKLDALAMDGFTVLHFAAQSNSIECIRLILQQAKHLLNRKCTRGSKTPLHLAVLKNNKESTDFLLKKGADMTIKTSKGETAFDLAKTVEIRKILQDHSKKLKEKEDEVKMKRSESKNEDNDDNLESIENDISKSKDQVKTDKICKKRTREETEEKIN